VRGRAGPARVALTVALSILAGCRGREPPRHPEWIIHAQLVFRARDSVTPRPAPPPGSYRLWFPYVIGDLYGAPGAGELQHPVLDRQGRFTLDLNHSLPDLSSELEPTQFSLSYLAITPADARIARLAPAALQAQGIDPIGVTAWVDASSNRPLMLLYVDRPAHIRGERVVQGGERVRYDITATRAGYLWVGEHSQAHATEYRAQPAPTRVLLVVSEAG
jgi:hypothetical protein